MIYLNLNLTDHVNVIENKITNRAICWYTFITSSLKRVSLEVT